MLIRFCLIVVLAPFSTMADVYKCSRTRISDTGFSSMQAAESWYPKTTTIEVLGEAVRIEIFGKMRDSLVKERTGEGKTKFVYVHNHSQAGRVNDTVKLNYVLFPNKSLSAQLTLDLPVDVGGAFYKCNVTYKQPSKKSDPKPSTSTNTGVKEKTAKSAVSSTMEKAKDTCEDLGFKPRTEKFGECVLRLLEN